VPESPTPRSADRAKPPRRAGPLVALLGPRYARGSTLTAESRSFLSSGAFAPVAEEVTLTDLPVEGAIPPELEGTLLRNGPNPYDAGAVGHWFAGDGMVHGLRLAGGQARWYRNRWVRTGRLAWRQGTGPEPELGDGDSPANTHVVRHARRLLALCEVGVPWELTPGLDTVGRYDFGGQLAGPMTAHPKRDATTGELVFFGYGWAPPYLRYHVADREGALVHSVEIEVRGPTMMHDCAITATRTLLLDLPVCFDPELVPRTALPYRFLPAYGARLGVLPRRGRSADVRWFEIEPCYVFHTLNAYDDGPDRVVVDAVRYASMFEWSAAREDFLPSPLASIHRYTLDLASGAVGCQPLDERPVEFPRIDDRATGRRHRYAYAARVERLATEDFTFRDVIKYDLRRGEAHVHAVGPADVVSEPVFVPAGGAAGEDEGWVLIVVYRAARGQSDVVILDATRLAGPAVATIRLPVRVPMGFHGAWVPETG
jgi:carotenoid cleavage dioxygenase-like enzyme